ncbi:MAG: hypothetical protein M0R06_01155 [Sphaerochaeta sp.]|jgi:hypothetical protein|nr:hypothetical protein [Sphaerochaeta sp.]
MDNLKMIQDRENELGNLYARMDKDRDAVRMKSYILTGFDTYKNREIPRTVSVTMNEPGVFAHALSSVLQKSVTQVVVEGMTDSRNKRVEDFINDMLYTVDVQLRKRRIASLKAWVSDQVCIRGPVCAKFTLNSDGTPNCVPVDTRDYSFVDGEWACNKTSRNRADLHKEKWFNDSMIPGGDSTKVVVRDFCAPDVNEIYIDNNKVFEEKNPYGVITFVQQCPAAGFYMFDDDWEQYWAESIFFLVRSLYSEWNRLMSIQQTKALEWVKPPYAHQVKDLSGQPQPYPHVIGTNTPYPEGEEPHLLETKDETRAFQGASQGMANAIHKGSANITDLADVSGIRNASWITEQTEIRNQLLMPRSDCLALWYADVANLLIKEYVAHDFIEPVKLGQARQARSYTVSDLGDPDEYQISFRYMPDNARQRLANYTVGISLRGTLSEDTIIRDIYQCDDPDGEIDKLRAEEARKANPIIFYYDLSARLCDVAATKTGMEKKRLLRQARVMADGMVNAIKQQKITDVGRESPLQPEQGTKAMQLPKSNGQSLMALPSLTGGGQNG